MDEYLRKLITPDMVSLWVPNGPTTGIDLIGRNQPQCFGTHPNVPVIAPPIDQISACDATTNWSPSAGGVLSIDTGDKKEGSSSLKETIASPEVDGFYDTSYNPAGSWDWSDKEHILCWFKCDRPSTAFYYAFLQAWDTSNNWRRWSLIFSAGEWMAIKELLSTGIDGPAPINLALINQVKVTFRALDTTPFYKKIDDVRVIGYPSLINPSVGWVFGGDDYIDIDDPVLGETAISISLWAKKSAYVQYQGLLVDYDGVNKNFILGYETPENTISFWVGDGTNTDNITKSGFIQDVWHHIVGVFDAATNELSLYINGEKATKSTTIANIGSTQSNVSCIGKYSNFEFNGDIALPSIVKGAWSQAQVDNNYLHTKGLFAPRG